MQPEDRLLRRIEELLRDRLSPAVAYPLRARLGRVVNEADRWIAGTTEPIEAVSLLARQMRDMSARLMQPSEPFDGIWQEKWVEVRESAERLQKLVEQERGRSGGSAPTSPLDDRHQ